MTSQSLLRNQDFSRSAAKNSQPSAREPACCHGDEGNVIIIPIWDRLGSLHTRV